MVEESLTFFSRYLNGIDIAFNRIRHFSDEIVSTLFPLVGKTLGSFTYFSLSSKEKLQAHRHVLINNLCPT